MGGCAAELRSCSCCPALHAAWGSSSLYQLLAVPGPPPVHHTKTWLTPRPVVLHFTTSAAAHLCASSHRPTHSAFRHSARSRRRRHRLRARPLAFPRPSRVLLGADNHRDRPSPFACSAIATSVQRTILGRNKARLKTLYYHLHSVAIDRGHRLPPALIARLRTPDVETLKTWAR